MKKGRGELRIDFGQLDQLLAARGGFLKHRRCKSTSCGGLVSREAAVDFARAGKTFLEFEKLDKAKMRIDDVQVHLEVAVRLPGVGGQDDILVSLARIARATASLVESHNGDGKNKTYVGDHDWSDRKRDYEYARSLRYRVSHLTEPHLPIPCPSGWLAEG